MAKTIVARQYQRLKTKSRPKC